MTVNVNNEQVVTKKRSAFSRGERIFIFSSFALLFLIIVYGMVSLTSFHVHSNFTAEEKASLAKSALMPQIANYIERDGVRGFQDADLQIETKTFASIDELVAAMPSLGCYKNSKVSRGSDVKGKSAKKYELAKVCPVSSRQSVLPLNFSSVSDQKVYWTWEYSILEYKDGSCRLVILEVPS